MKRKLLAKKTYPKNNARVCVYQLIDNKDKDGDVISLCMVPAKGRGKPVNVAMRPDEALSVAGMIIEAVHSVCSGFHITTRISHAFDRPRRRRS